MSDEIIIKFDREGNDCSLFFEDNGKVAYAYIIENDEVISDVWLYNHGYPPEQPEWKDKSKMPFRNPRSYVCEHSFLPVKKIEEVTVKWIGQENNQGVIVAQLSIRDKIHAYLKSGSKPGWSRMAIKDGPLAKTLDSFIL
jgi:hypothetical protein